VARECKADRRAMGMLLDALAALGVIAKADGKYFVPDDHRELLLPGPQCVVPGILHRKNLWDSWSKLTEVVRTGAPAVTPYEEDQRPDEQVKEFIAAMAVSARYEAPKTAELLELGEAKNLLDIGGGPGAYVSAFCKAAEQLHCTVLDFPRVCGIAGQNIAEEPFAGRIGFVEGEARSVSDTVVLAASGGDGYDVVFTSNLIHSMDDDQTRELIGRMVGWTKPGGRTVVKDFLLSDDKTEPAQGVVFAINMLVNTPGGRSYSFSEVEGWLKEAALAKGITGQLERVKLPESNSGMVVFTRDED